MDTAQALPVSLCGDALYDRIADALVGPGYIRLEHVLPEAIYQGLILRSRQLEEESAFRRAGIGRELQHQLDSSIRSDEIRWLRRDNTLEADFLDWAEQLRLEMNRRLFLGLFDYEAHFAHYAPGAFYKRHLDAFAGQSNRRLTTVLYLNPEWGVQDGGELLIYSRRGREPIERIAPGPGVLLVFLSEAIPHEVLPARRDRYSIAGWFRVNGSHAGMVDPAR